MDFILIEAYMKLYLAFKNPYIDRQGFIIDNIGYSYIISRFIGSKSAIKWEKFYIMLYEYKG